MRIISAHWRSMTHSYLCLSLTFSARIIWLREAGYWLTRHSIRCFDLLMFLSIMGELLVALLCLLPFQLQSFNLLLKSLQCINNSWWRVNNNKKAYQVLEIQSSQNKKHYMRQRPWHNDCAIPVLSIFGLVSDPRILVNCGSMLMDEYAELSSCLGNGSTLSGGW